MSHNQIELKEGAYIISDAHHSSLRPELLFFIKDIHSKKLQPTQLFLFGDVFDALFGSVTKTIQNNQVMIDMINDISLEMDVVYLEGNHDFNLKNIFPHAKVFTISQQPVECSFQGKKIYIAHGDYGENTLYRVYTSIIRNRLLLPVLNIINNLLGDFILTKLDQYLGKKEDCNEFEDFEEYVAKRLENRFQCDYFIEGHFHQNKTFDLKDFTYINLGAFACNQSYFVVESREDKKLLCEHNYQGETHYG